MARRNRRGKNWRGGKAAQIGTEPQEIIPKYALIRRAEAFGIPAEQAKKRGPGRVKAGAVILEKADGSSNLGILMNRGILSLHHYDAGLKLWDVYRRWKAAIESKPRHARPMNYDGRPVDGPPPVEMDEEACQRAERAFNAAVAVIPRGLCWKLVEAAVIDPANILDTAPRLVERSGLGDRLRAELVRSMDCLCQHFGISSRNLSAA